jgi:hypothetical protein
MAQEPGEAPLGDAYFHFYLLAMGAGRLRSASELMAMMTEEQKANFKPLAIPLKAGHAAFHHPLLVHGSFANFSPRSRKAFVLIVFADGTVSDTDEPLLEGVPVIPKGQKMDGKFFPLIFDPRELEGEKGIKL